MGDVFKKLSGPEPYRVYQRDKSNKASIDVAGELIEGAEGTVEVRLTKAGKSSESFDWKGFESSGESFGFTLDGVPVGGPYTLELRVRQGSKVSTSRKIPGILVGDLWVLAGQSNMDGCGKLLDLEKPSQYVNCFYYGDRWNIAKDPLCWLNESIDSVHWFHQDTNERAAAIEFEKKTRMHGAGLGVRFGKDMYKATGVPVGLIMCSHGGTSMEQWSPRLKDKGGDSLYGCMIRRVEAVGGKVAGCLWYQGESDALSEAYKVYRETFRSFMESVRADLNSPNLPFIYVQISLLFGDDTASRDGWNRVQNDQLLVESDLDNVAFAAAIDLTMSDIIHLDGASQRKLGARLAKLARRLAFGDRSFEVGPRPAGIDLSKNDTKSLTVRYESVNGSLTPSRDIRGFSVEKDGAPCFIKSCVRGKDGKSVVITFYEPVPEGAELWYGRGISPVCNLADRAGFAAPVFGPVKIG